MPPPQPPSSDLERARALKAEAQMGGARKRIINAGATASAVGFSETGSFEVLIRGEIEAVRGPDRPVFVSFAFNHGADWQPLSGAIFGTSQQSKPSIDTVGSHVAKWEGVDGIGRARRESLSAVNYPFDVVYKSSTPHGWPRLSLVVYGQDWCNRRVMIGTASVVLPAQPGRHKRTLRLIRPAHPSWFGRFMMWLTGKSYEDDISNANSLRLQHVESDQGLVDVHFEILTKDTSQFRLKMKPA